MLALIRSYLHTLPEPLFTYSLVTPWLSVLTAEAQTEAATRVVRRLPSANRVVARALLALCAKLAAHADANGATPIMFGRFFGPLMLRAPYVFQK
jgi:hypothetical protein